MPEGVEHGGDGRVGHGGRGVRTALMPEGVEHSHNNGGDPTDLVVRTALMPEGVEHTGDTALLKRYGM